jgi:hypothetical protein
VNQSPVVRELFSDVSPLGKVMYDDKLLHLHCDRRSGAKGLAALPNRQFKLNLHGLVMNGVALTRAKGGQMNSGGRRGGAKRGQQQQAETALLASEVLPETYFLSVIMAAGAQAGPFLQFQASCSCGTL